MSLNDTVALVPPWFCGAILSAHMVVWSRSVKSRVCLSWRRRFPPYAVRLSW